MTRVSSFGQMQQMVNGLLANQQRVAEDQRQLNTGKIADDFQGLASSAATLLGAKSSRKQLETFESMIDTVNGRLDGNDVQLEGILSISRNFRQAVLETIAGQQAVGFEEILDETFSFIASSLNTKLGGQYIFSGSKTEVRSVNADGLADLIAAANSDDLFQNDQLRNKANIAAGVTLEYGLVADEIASDLFKTLKVFADLNAGGLGPIDGNLTTAQVDALKAELGNLDAAIDATQTVQLRNGLRSGRVETILEQHQDTKIFLDTFISALEDADMAEVITRLNTDQTALEASYRTMATLTNLSLLDYI